MACCVGVLVGASTSHAASSVFTKDNAMSLAQLRATEQEAISVAIVAVRGQRGSVAAAVRSAGGRVRYEFAPVDFLSAVVPARAVSNLLAHPGIEAAGIDDPDTEFRYRGLMPEMQSAGSDAGGNVLAPLGARPLVQPYDVLAALDADEFRKRNPSFDGRGVVIAHVEAMSDMLLPEMQTARDIDGREVPKFLDVLNNPVVKATLAARAPRSDWQWVALSAPIDVSQGSIEHEGKRFRVPQGSTRYRVGTIEIPAYILMPINLPHRTQPQASGTDHMALMREWMQKKTVTWSVLWSDSAGAAWLDADENGDFTDEQAVREYRTSHDIGVLGRDDPATARRESRSYVVQKDGEYISITTDSNLHSTMVASVASASRGRSGRLDGIAPGAQVIAIKGDKTYSGYAWALIAAFADERSDVVLIEASMPPTGGQAVKDGRSVLGTLLSRLVRRYPKPNLFTAGNFAAMSAIIDASIVPESISVGAYDEPESLQLHFGMLAPERGTLHAIGSEGPAGNGAMKPDLLAPSMMIGLRDGYLGNDSMSSMPGLFRLPEGYLVSGGTSAAAPIATGATALLVSAAKQSGLPHDARTMKRALLGSARYLPGAGTYQQGAGVLQVDAAWERLREHGSRSEPLSIDVVAPVRTATSHLLATPHQGVGVFEREGWRAGDRGVRRVTLTRRNGGAGARRFMTRWRGNGDGTFAVPNEIDLPLGRPVHLDIAIAPAKEGVYSATLELIADSQASAAVAVPVTIVVPYELEPANGFAREVSMIVPAAGRNAVFVRVPEGVDALTFEASHASKATYIGVYNPAGDRIGFGIEQNQISGRSIETIATPMPGVWSLAAFDQTGRAAYFRVLPEFATLQDATAPPPVKIDLRISAAAVSITAGEGSAASLRDGEAVAVTVKNSLAALEEGELVSKVAALRASRGEIARGERCVFDVDVRAGAEHFVATVAPTSTEHLDADLYLFDCTDARCTLARAGRSYGSRERVFVQDPKPGRWRVILDASAAAAPGRMQFEYSDFFTLEDAGVIAVADRAIPRAASAEWRAQIKPWLFGSLEGERTPVAALFVHDSLRTSRLGAESTAAAMGCKTYPFCGSERQERAPLGLTLVSLDRKRDARTALATSPRAACAR